MNNETERVFSLSPSVNERIEMPGTTHLNLEDVEDFSNVCRICATVTEFVIPIFSGEGQQNNLAVKIHDHLPIKVTEQDVLPRVVCCQCANTLMAWHELVQCCVQANVALHTRAAMLEPHARHKDVKPVQPGPSEGNKYKFKEIGDDVSRTIDPPEYGNPVSPLVAPIRVCEYCSTEQPDTVYKKHLFDEHCDLVFLCDECDSYIDRRELIVHMSVHAAHYSTKKIESAKSEFKTEQNTKSVKDENENSKIIAEIKDVTETDAPENIKCDNKEQENEFSDHSDMESNFGPLPESVFEAIEDTQDDEKADTTNDSSDSPKPEAKKMVNQKKIRKCPLCSKVYTASSSYFYHLKHSHKQSKDYECDVCGKRFGTKANLTQHLTIHTGECPYTCKECGKRFRSKASQYIHEQTHTGIKMFSCKQCRTSFRWRTHLLRHLQRHALEKAHACATCGRAFSVRCDLLRHARTHRAGAFACHRCGLHFAQLRYLKVHMDNKHSMNKLPKTSKRSLKIDLY